MVAVEDIDIGSEQTMNPRMTAKTAVLSANICDDCMKPAE